MDVPQSEHPHTHYAHEHGHDRGPYWKRAHRDWKLWIAVVIMLLAMVIYIRSNDLSVRPQGQLQQRTP
jgi:uncharacterized integral membrane protein